MERQAGAFGLVHEAFKKQRDEIKSQGAAFQRLRDEIESQGAAFQRQRGAIKNRNPAFQRQRGAIESHRAAMRRLVAAFEAAVSDAAQQSAALSTLGPDMEKNRDVIRRQTESTQ